MLKQFEFVRSKAPQISKQSFTDELATYRDHLSYERNLSPKTTESYLIHLYHYYSFLGFPLREANKDDFKDFLKHLRLKGYKNSTIGTYLAVIRSFYNYLANNEDEERFKQVAFYVSKNFRIPKDEPAIQVPSAKEVEQLRDFFKFSKTQHGWRKHKHDYRILLRDIAIFETLIATGVRSSELRGIRVEDFDFTNNTVYVRAGKAAHQRFAIFNSFAKESILEHISHNHLNLSDPMFKMAQGNMLNYIIKRWARRAGINPHIHAHSLRHYHITAAQRLGISINSIADQVGHKCFNTTRKYSHFDLDFRRQQYGDKKI